MTEEAPRGRLASGVAFLAAMTLGYGVYAADRTVLTSMLVPLSADLGLTGLQQGLLVSAQYIGVLGVVLVAGVLSDRVGRLRIILVGVAVFTIFTWLIAVSTSFYEAFGFRLASGVGEGMFWPVAMAAVADRFGREKGLALGAFYVGFDLGGAGGTAVGGATYALSSDWRAAFLVAPLLGVAAIAGIFLARGAMEGREGSGLGLQRGSMTLARGRNMAVLLLIAFLATYATAAWQSYLPTYLKKVLGLDVPAAAFGTAAVLLAGAVGKVVLGRASDSLRRGRLLAVASGLALALYAAFFSTSNVTLGLALGMSIGFFGSAMFPVMQALASDSSGGRVGTALGLTTTFQSLATVFAPTVTSLFFPQGVGAAIEYNVMVPMALVLLVALLVRDPRTSSSVHSA